LKSSTNQQRSLELPAGATRRIDCGLSPPGGIGLKQRIVTGAILALVMIPVFFLSGTWIYVALMTILSAIGTWEMLGCVGERKNYWLSVPALVVAVATPLMSYFYRYGVIATIVMCYLFFMLFVSVFTGDKVNTQSVSVVFTTTIYVVTCFVSLLRLRYISSGGEVVGQYVYLLVFIAAWVTDTFAYFTGVFFGKHKLIPKISPKKTVEGSVGGMIFCVVAFVIYGAVLKRIAGFEPNYIGLCLVGLVMSVLSQLGDLLASAIKRSYGVKDYGKLFPGHGGILDRFDSILVLSPFLLLFMEDSRFLFFLFG